MLIRENSQWFYLFLYKYLATISDTNCRLAARLKMQEKPLKKVC